MMILESGDCAVSMGSLANVFTATPNRKIAERGNVISTVSQLLHLARLLRLSLNPIIPQTKAITVSSHKVKAGGATCQVRLYDAYNDCNESTNNIKHKMKDHKLYFLPNKLPPD